MAINLVKGQKIDLTKGNSGLDKILVGLGWDPIAQKKGFFGGTVTPNIDCDASAIMLNENGKISATKDVIYFGNLRSGCGSVVHTGDNLTGDGDGDDEQLIIELSKIPQNIHKIVFVVNIYSAKSRKQHFGMIQNAFIRVEDMKNHNELIRFNLTDNYNGSTALLVGELYRHNNEWKFNALGQGTNDTSLSELAKRFQ